jgi:hypothetical protein
VNLEPPVVRRVVWAVLRSSFDSFGTSLALSADGSVHAVGAVGAVDESSSATGVNGIPTAVYVFTRTTSWAQTAYVKASNTGSLDQSVRPTRDEPNGLARAGEDDRVAVITQRETGLARAGQRSGADRSTIWVRSGTIRR